MCAFVSCMGNIKDTLGGLKRGEGQETQRRRVFLFDDSAAAIHKLVSEAAWQCLENSGRT